MITGRDLEHIAATIIARARNASGLSAPAFDYQISTEGIGGPHGWLGQEAYRIANEHPGDAPGLLAERDANHLALWEALRPELEAYARRCGERRYSGWSNAARSLGQPIQYATDEAGSADKTGVPGGQAG
ncbi:hypothetical protein I0C86_41085 [Plantactinospora sp. S1510]|uniref:Uncharacterized protein n=1 Tax=Plantactinospora alkalitolerans TaxID=2789879 RepID=A0ABS0H9U0_9ACTN|nr:hypothetical protein [Plantactinospora alkalitolerans]MBF9135247.1 hypothetical protein [Plantactinospora alkalitolerans]